jgi:hypothetical protein
MISKCRIDQNLLFDLISYDFSFLRALGALGDAKILHLHATLYIPPSSAFFKFAFLSSDEAGIIGTLVREKVD